MFKNIIANLSYWSISIHLLKQIITIHLQRLQNKNTKIDTHQYSFTSNFFNQNVEMTIAFFLKQYLPLFTK